MNRRTVIRFHRSLSPLARRALASLCLSIFFAPALCLAQTEKPAAPSAQPMPLTLSQAIDLALKQNRDLKLAQLAVKDTEAKKDVARSYYFPNIKNESTILHITELQGVAIPAGAFGHGPATGLIPPENLTIDQGSLTAYTSGTGLHQPITQMFKIRQMNRAADADLSSSKIKLDQAGNEVTLRVRQLYYALLVAQLKQQAAEADVAAGELKLKETQDAVTGGKSLEIAALESRASLLEARQQVLTYRLQSHNLTLSLNDLLGLPLQTQLLLDAESSSSTLSIPSRAEAVRLAQEQSPEIREARQKLLKAGAGLSAAKDEYIPDVTGVARYSYQSGVPFLVHNFGTFGLVFTYTLFDGGRRRAEVESARTVRSEAEVHLAKIEEEVAVQVESAYDKVEQLESLVRVAEEALNVRIEAARIADRQFEQDAALASARSAARARAAAARASFVEANLGLTLAQADLKRLIGEMPR